ncbi:unnamed protein product [Dovyalis caffra]|uniref:Uncharacterized protein n=1 Tax=Dovyalis caffra TaxID=77055 RepID=A0AAV1RD62_9ROSI|nr:unnamed protein product [Dovyalis caffra]
MDDLADQFGIGTLRLTTRQTFQLHGVLKKNLKTVMSSIIHSMGSTLGACGDLNRNSGFYYDMSVDGEKIMKFKVAVTVSTDNSVDLLTNDVGVVVVTDADGEPQGFNIYVGGGMGRTHRLETTFPRLAESLGYEPKEDILYAIENS